MMTVGTFDTIEHAEARAAYYRSRGYVVRILGMHDSAGSLFKLICTFPLSA